jgi:hypothetical protein
MAGAADRNEFGEALNDSKNDCVKKIHRIREWGVGNG